MEFINFNKILNRETISINIQNFLSNFEKKNMIFQLKGLFIFMDHLEVVKLFLFTIY